MTPVLAPAPSRNARCPCGSGKRYKACHGALSNLSDHDAGAATRVREGIAAHGGGRLHEAKRAYAAALALRPGDAVAAHNLAVIRMQRGDALGAIPTLEWTVQSRPDDPELLGNLGVAYAAVDRFEAAVDAHRHALALDHTRPGAWSNLGLALVQLARHDEAIDAFTHALAIDPSFAKARWHRAMARLARGDRGGWDDFEARLDVLEPGTAPDLPGVPRYRGGDLGGRTLLVDDEQGYGDTLQCARHVGTLADRGARVIVRARDEIAALLRSARGVAEVVSLGAVPPCDAWLPMMSLPGALGVAPQGDDAPAPYLHPDPARVAQVRMKLERAPARLRVGLSWAGNPGQVNDRRRSCPLAALAPLLERGDIAWYSLQRHDGEDPIPTVPAAGRAAPSRRVQRLRRQGRARRRARSRRQRVHVHCPSRRRARPPVVPDARAGARLARGLGSSTTGWYPTARLFRQAGPGDWNGVVRDVGAALDTFDRA